MELRQLRVFLAVLEEGSITAGARRLFLSQPTATRQLQALERSLDVALFERQAGGVRPTPAGEVLGREARRLLAAADRLGERVSEAREPDEEDPRGPRRLRLGVFQGRVAAAELTDLIITAFRGRHPDVALEVRVLPLADPWGRREDLDVLLVRGAGAEQDDVSVLFEEPHVVRLPATHRLVELVGDTPASLSAVDLAGEVLQDAAALHRPADRAFFDTCDLRGVPGLAGVRRMTLPGGARYDQILAASAAGALITVSAGSAARLTDAVPLRLVPLHDVAPVTAVLAIRRPGPLAERFRRTALDIARDMLALVPEARAPGWHAANVSGRPPLRPPVRSGPRVHSAVRPARAG